jgi:dipeptidyl aminopeptidase/acylaminoacyl peptidase/CubicO group peptidase (beta-lactamase class C family)
MGRALRYDDLFAFREASDPRISPDGTTVAFVVTRADEAADANRSSIWTVATDGATEARQLTFGDNDGAPRWSPDGSQLAFLREGQLWLLPAGGGEARKLTSLASGAGAAEWSPDGKRIAITAPVDLRGDVDDKKKEAAPVVVRTGAYKADGAGMFGERRMHLFVVDAETGEAKHVVAGDVNVSFKSWSPDGTKIAFVRSTPEMDLEPRTKLFVIDLKTERTKQLAADWEGTFGSVLWATGYLLCTGAPHPGAVHTRLYAVPESGDGVTELTRDFDRNVMIGGPAYPGALPTVAGDKLIFCARDRGCTHAYEVHDFAVTKIIGGDDRVVAGLTIANDTIAYVLSTSQTPGDIFVSSIDGSNERQLTQLNKALLEDIDLHPQHSRVFTAPDGLEIHGWVIEGDGPKPQPLLVDIHGGPHNAWNGAFDTVHLYHEILASQGWSILKINPRGSDGYGEDFYSAVVGKWGVVDEDDFHSAIDTLVAEGLADRERLAVCGYSYGGHMTNWLTARTDRFAAAVSGGCLSNVASFYGNSDVGWFLGLYEMGGELWDKRHVFEELSPLSYVANVRTPTLILHGENDLRCPVGQAEEWFISLRRLGVTTEMVRYPGASHLFILLGRPSHRIDYNRRVEDWVVRYTNAGTRPKRRLDQTRLQARLTELVAKHDVPGATIGVLHDGDIFEAAAGVTSLETKVPVTTDTVFQIGSMTKPWTTTVIMQLVDEGKIDLDAPVRTYLPNFSVADPDVTEKVTLRHLLSHTSGIDGDHFKDFGRGDDCLEKYVDACETLGQTHPLGATMSYCNTGFSIAGRITEVLDGKVWDHAMRDRLFTPLGLTHTSTLPEEAIMHRAAVGHVKPDPTAGWKPAPVWILPRIAGPMGLVNSTVRDVLTYAQLHLNNGRTADGTQLISEASVAAMQEPQVEIPDPHSLGSHWGVGWILFDWNGRRLYGHDGNTIGQSAFLRIAPDANLAITLLTNGGNAGALHRELVGELMAELADIDMPKLPQRPATPLEMDLTPYAGTYERLGIRIDLEVQGNKLAGVVTQTGELAKVLDTPPRKISMIPVDSSTFLTFDENEEGPGGPAVFYDFVDGRPSYVHTGARTHPRRG